jgi:RNA polymerase sigma-70 factor, ECF subfamily
MLDAMAERRSLEADDDLALVERARGGDRSAFERLVSIHLPRVWRVVWRVVRDDADADDVSQETFLTAWQSLAGYRGECRFSTWLHRIAVTRALNHLDRSSERMRRASVPLEAGPGEDPGDPPQPIAALPAAGPSPLQALEARDVMRRLAECLGKLPASWRAVVALRDGEARSYEEIATVLGIALGTVRSRLARARFALKESVEGARP